MDLLKEWVALALSFIALGGTFWNWLQAPSAKNALEFSSFQKEVGEEREKDRREAEKLRDRVGALETAVKQLPTKDDFHGIDKGLTEVRGEMKALSLSSLETSRTVHRIEDFMLKAGGGN